jgi:hypothetical protein
MVGYVTNNVRQRTAFYELPSSRLSELEDVARRGSKADLTALLADLPRPVPTHESPHYVLAAALGVIGDTPLPHGAEMLADGSARFTRVLESLVEGHGEGWEIIEPSDERIAALEPKEFDAARLQAHYAGEVDYYPDENTDDEDETGEKQGLLADLIDRLASQSSEEDYPPDAGMQLLGCIGLLRTALDKVDRRSVLLIHLM